MKLIDKDAVLAMIEELESQNNCGTDDFIESKRIAYKQVKDGILEMQEIVSMQEETVSEDLGEYINELSKQFPEVSFAKLSRIAVRVAKWQKQQIMKEAVDGIVEYKYSRSGKDLFNVSSRNLLDAANFNLNNGEKVKLLIIKEK